MAISESIRAALFAMSDELFIAKCTCDAFGTLHDEIPRHRDLRRVDEHAWVFAVSRMVDRLVEAGERLEVELNCNAFPVLDRYDAAGHARSDEGARTEPVEAERSHDLEDDAI